MADKKYQVYDKNGVLRDVTAASPEDAFDKVDNAKRSWAQTGRAVSGEFLQGIPGVSEIAQPAAAKFRAALGLGQHGSNEDAQLRAIKGADSAFRKEQPEAAFGSRVAGGMTAAAPFMPVLSAIGGPTLAGQLATQIPFGMAWGGADTAAKEYSKGNLGKPGSTAKISEDAMLNGLFSAAGPLAGKLITPGHVKYPTPEANAALQTTAANRVAAQAPSIIDQVTTSTPSVPLKPTNIKDQIQHAKDAANYQGFEDLLKDGFHVPGKTPLPPSAKNVQISPAQIEQQAGEAASKRIAPTWEAPSPEVRSALTHGVGAGIGAIAGQHLGHDAMPALLSAILGGGAAPYVQQLGSSAFKGVGLHPEHYWGNQFMNKHPSIQELFNSLGLSTGNEAGEKYKD